MFKKFSKFERSNRIVRRHLSMRLVPPVRSIGAAYLHSYLSPKTKGCLLCFMPMPVMGVKECLLWGYRRHWNEVKKALAQATEGISVLETELTLLTRAEGRPGSVLFLGRGRRARRGRLTLPIVVIHLLVLLIFLSRHHYHSLRVLALDIL